MELLDYERSHINYLKENAAECSLFLKCNNEFPLDGPCDIVLVGNGARNTIKGGTGSGDVASRFFLTIEEGLKEAGFTITSNEWLDKYDEFRKSTKKDFIKETKSLAKKNYFGSYIYSMGFFEEEHNYDFPCSYDGSSAIYVLSRNSGEGNDRRNIKGDVKLSDKEVEDILYLNSKFKKFMLVLNVGGVIDLSPVMEVENILLLSQLGVVTGDIFANIILGKANPSGKLSTTWAKPEDYPSFNEFGNLHDTYYKEGIYVGYRYFRTTGTKDLFPFGFGKSYTDFKIEKLSSSLEGNILQIKVKVTNIGNFAGKEVAELYVSKPNDRLEQPLIELVGFKKSNSIKPNESEELSLDIDILKCFSYDADLEANVLLKGDYIFSIGNSSINNIPYAKVSVSNDVIIEKLGNKLGESGFIDTPLDCIKSYNLTNVDIFELDLSNIQTKVINYQKNTYVDPMIEKLTDNELAHICVGHFDNGLAALVGSSCKHVYGGAGETVLNVPTITKSLTMADGPAGLRLKQIYGEDKKGKYDVTMEPFMEKMLDYLPKLAAPFIKPPKNRKGTLHYQYTTAIPIGTALAQSFNRDFVYECGKLVAEEMEIFNVDLWLAPALNIHRNILCGRNFEYYSEDPYLSGMIASSMVKGVEESGRGTTIKHFAFNNQELNRNNNSSHVSERAAREIYLRGFEICIKDANPKALMTSYNLINGIHTCESYPLINDILRCEWEYKGLVMSDWMASGRSFCRKIKYKAPYASNLILAGNDLTMPGCNKDVNDILKALKQGKITREQLVICASRVYRSIVK